MNRALGTALTLLAIELGGFVRFATAQVPARPPPTGSLSGRVLDDSARGLAGAEAVIAALQMRALTGPDGKFRIGKIPPGNWSLLIRAIGFLPNTQDVSVRIGSMDIGVVQLHRAIVPLPEIAVTGKLPSPAFALAFSTNLESGSNCAWCGRPRDYIPLGASMTEDGLYLALAQLFSRKDPPSIAFRAHGIGLNPRLGHKGHVPGFLLCNPKAKPLATRIDGIVGRVLYTTGAIWREALDPWSYDCVAALRLAFNGVPATAAALPEGWVVAVQDSTGSVTLQRFNDYGRKFWTLALEDVLGTATPIKNVALAPADGGVTVALAESPFVWALVDSSGAIVRQSSPLLGSARTDLLAQTELRGWRGFAVLPVRNGFVQTLESPDHKEGFFVVYNILGRPVKVMRRSGASVLIASAPALRMLLGYQYNSPWGGSSRLFLYRY